MTSQRVAPVPRLPGAGHAVLSGARLRVVPGVSAEPRARLSLRLPSYRSLPLSCVEGLDLEIDGVAVPADRMALLVNTTPYALSQLGSHPEVWWFVLDHAEIEIAGWPLDAGEHAVTAVLTTVEPYVSNGRFSFVYRDSAVLVVDDPRPEGMPRV
ncbi:MAG: DUF6379 domain-containing protein [Nocardioides sp.]|uniref:C-glycoside deglycosidase beta subunit domain-containing protein n=1 Tax=Nocardioides sp. TaxID=35761 RepID=UPI0039E2EA47